MQNKDDSINKRIASYRSLAGYTQETASSALGMNKNTYARMERSGSPKPEVLKKLAELFNVSAELILYGESGIITTEPPNDSAEFHDNILTTKQSEQLILTTNERNCIKLCRNLSNKDRTELVEYINKYVEKRASNEE